MRETISVIRMENKMASMTKGSWIFILKVNPRGLSDGLSVELIRGAKDEPKVFDLGN